MISECTLREFIQMVKIEDPKHKDIWEVESPDGWKVLDVYERGDALEKYVFWYTSNEEGDYDEFFPHDIIRYRRIEVGEDEEVLIPNTPWIIYD